jgi:hypothetical protein
LDARGKDIEEGLFGCFWATIPDYLKLVDTFSALLPCKGHIGLPYQPRG